jgi:hypothetical protein
MSFENPLWGAPKIHVELLACQRQQENDVRGFRALSIVRAGAITLNTHHSQFRQPVAETQHHLRGAARSRDPYMVS